MDMQNSGRDEPAINIKPKRKTKKRDLTLLIRTQTGNVYSPLRQYSDGVTVYQYVKSDPMNRTDVLGLGGTSGSWDDGGLGSGYIGGEAHFFLGLGMTAVTCKDKCGHRRVMLFRKRCIGGAIGAGGGVGAVIGISGIKCKPETYEKWFYELGVGSIGVDIGYDDSNWTYPGMPSGVVEGGWSPGKFLAGFKSTWCYYSYLRDLQ